jgi:hypothetical protein
VDAMPNRLVSHEFKWWVGLPAQVLGIRLWCSWETHGVAKRFAELDIARILAASRASQPAWSE